MTDREYIEERLDGQIHWYSKANQRNQRWYRTLTIIQIVSAVSIPFLASYISDTTISLKIVVAFLGFIVAIISGALGIYKFQENWIEYRTTSQSLKHEKFVVLTGSELYGIEWSIILHATAGQGS